jgi:hypothetical protein
MNGKLNLHKIPVITFIYRNFYPSTFFKKRSFSVTIVLALVLAFAGGVFYYYLFSGLLGGSGKEPHGMAVIAWPFITMLSLLVYLGYLNYKTKIIEIVEQIYVYILILVGSTLGALFFYDLPLNGHTGFRQFIESLQWPFFYQEIALVLIWTLSISVFGYLFVTIKNLRTYKDAKKSYLFLYLRQIALCVLPTSIGVIMIITMKDPLSNVSLRGVFAGITLRLSLFFALIMDLEMSMKKYAVGEPPPPPELILHPYEYDVALSFAGEDRTKAEELAEILKKVNISVFYDKYEKGALWGKDLYEHLAWVYKDAARYCIMFISEHYKRKLWTTHERKNAQARAFREQREYILPVRLDDTEIPGITGTTGYIDLRGSSCQEVADLIIQKLKGENGVRDLVPGEIVPGEIEAKE